MTIRPLVLAVLLSACGASTVRPQSGAMIAVHFAATPIDDALHTVAAQAHVNVDAADAGITGTVTLDMHAPWRIVLARIADDHGLHLAFGDRIVRVCATPCDTPPERGAPITAAFDDTPIRDAAAAFARVANLEVVVDPDVQVAVTMHVRNAPWDLALDHLARKYDLAVARTGHTLRISNAPRR